ncbi:hypothetical protein [Actinopolyspora xinjiangensis]|uniref:hypothetical protein n=1 Tax=Actinopolyspora xinjiangensis TaxID=405564 RepID=UPI0014811AB8|nr:hypothetical protein [Actinopolyspora xinjiangensis]
MRVSNVVESAIRNGKTGDETTAAPERGEHLATLPRREESERHRGERGRESLSAAPVRA